jgi:site-specific DNA recombinase
MNFAFYGLATATSRRAARPVHADQLTAATKRVQRHGGVIVADYFDVYPNRRRAVRHCRHGRRLLQAIQEPHRDFGAVVIGDTRSTLTPYRYDELLSHCDNHDIQLWIPEIDDPIDPNSDHHQKIMSELFWGPLATALHHIRLPVDSTPQTDVAAHGRPTNLDQPRGIGL